MPQANATGLTHLISAQRRSRFPHAARPIDNGQSAVFANLHFKHYESAVSVAIPEELWLAMGISVTSLVGSALILENKKVKEPTTTRLELIANRTGVLVNSQKPSLRDLIGGEEVGNYDRIDLTRLQNLLFTFVLVGTYMATLNNMFATLVTVTPQVQDIALNFPIKEFPPLGSSAVALLLISHAGYLAAKAIDNQPSETVAPSKPAEPPKPAEPSKPAEPA